MILSKSVVANLFSVAGTILLDKNHSISSRVKMTPFGHSRYTWSELVKFLVYISEALLGVLASNFRKSQKISA